MTKTNNIAVRMLAVLFSLISVFTIFSTTAFAATSSSGKSTRTITVSTKANWWYPGSESITLSQTKGTRTSKVFSKTKTSNRYGAWKINVRATDGSHSYNSRLTGSSVKLSLKPNKTYKITVSWDSDSDIIDTIAKGAFTKLPTWRVSKTHKVSSYY